jgi:putative ABC transport system permease protein
VGSLEIIDLIAKPPLVLDRTETVEAPTMLRPADAKQEGAIMVDLKAVEGPFPFYGQITLSDGRIFKTDILKNHGIVVARPVLDRLSLKVGDSVKIGDLVFEIRGIIEREPSTGLGFRYGPRVLMERSAIDDAGLTGFGSRARRRILLKAPNTNPDELVKKIRTELKNNMIRVRSYRNSQERINEQYTRAENFLSLTGLIILVLGGIGISSVTRVFIEQKRKTIAVLKCLGGTGLKVTASYLTQILTLGLTGSLVGVALAAGAMKIVEHYYAATLPVEMNYHLRPGAVMQGLGIGMLVTILFSALPLLRIRLIKPNVLLRDENQISTRKFDPLRWSIGVLVTIGLILLSSWQAGSLKIGLFFLGGLLTASVILFVAAVLIMKWMRRIRNVRAFDLRYAVSSLYRPGNQTKIIILGTGLGVFFIVTTYFLQINLMREFDVDRHGQIPNMYLIDIQSDQKAGVERLIQDQTGEKAELVPAVRARIYAINGTPVNFEDPQHRKDRDRLGFEYNLTYSSKLQPTEEIIEGKFWDNTPSSQPEISLDESLKGMMGLELGGTVTWDILGRKITSRVTSIRRIDWRNSRTAFYVVFRPGVLEKAPQMLIAAVDGPADEIARSRFQRVLIDNYPNVTVIDVVDIIRGVRKLVNNITLAVSFIGTFVFLSGTLILAGSIAMTKFQRIYEAAVLKTLGAKRKLILRMLILEYGVLGLVAGFIGATAGTLLSWIVSKWVFEIQWDYLPLVHLLGIVGAAIAVMAVGALSSLDILNKKPLATLRSL